MMVMMGLHFGNRQGKDWIAVSLLKDCASCLLLSSSFTLMAPGK
jgi:hypothetical protein